MIGVQTCEPTGTFGKCACDPLPDRDAGGADAATARSDAETEDASSPPVDSGLATDSGGRDATGSGDATPAADATSPDVRRADADIADAGSPDAAWTDVGVIDGGFGDAGLSYGVRISAVSAGIVGPTPDGLQVVLRHAGNRLEAVPASGVGAPQAIAPAAGAYSLPMPALWFMSVVRPSWPAGDLRVWLPGGTTARNIALGAAWRLGWFSAGGEWAVATENMTDPGGTNPAPIGDLIVARADGTRKLTFARAISVGTWDPSAFRFTGDCVPTATFTSTRTAVAAVCTNPAVEQLELLMIDLVSGSTISAGTNAFPNIRPSPGGRFFLWWDRSATLFATDAATGTTRQVTSSAWTAGHLDDRRFVYTRGGGELWVATWPTLAATRLLTAGALLVRGLSPAGDHVLVSASQGSPHDLYVVATSSAAVSVPVALSVPSTADLVSPSFSPDGASVHWLANSSAFIGELMARPASGSGPTISLASSAYAYARGYANDARAVVFPNAMISGNTIVSDLATVPRDGSATPTILVTGVNAWNHAVMPGGGHIVYRVDSGPNAGVFVRPLQ